MIKKIIVIVLSLSIVALITGIIISNVHKNKDNYVLSVKEAYSLTFDDEAIITVPLFFSKENKFSDFSNIKSLSIKNDKIKINCDLIDVADCGKRIYQNEYLFARAYEIKIPCKNSLLIDNAKLIINSNGEDLEILIGSISLRHYESLGNKKDLTVNNASVLAGSGTIEGMIVNIESSESVKITDFIVDNTSVFVDLNEIKNVTNEYNENNFAKDIISDYNLYTKQANFTMPELIVNGSVTLFLPFKYIDKLIMEQTPLIIKYEINDVMDEYVLDDFKYVNHLYNIVDIGGIEKCKI